MDVRFFDNSLKELSDEIEIHQQRAFLYGDAHFTTTKVVGGEIEHLQLHIERLQKAHKSLKMSPILWQKLTALLANIAGSITLGMIKVQISRGQAQRGYGDLSRTQPLVVITSGELTPSWFEQQLQAIDLPIAETRLGIQPLLAGLKHCNRLEQVLIAHEIEQQQWQDALVLNIHEQVIETNKANVFWYDGTHWYTSSLHLCGVDGVMRQYLLNKVNVHVVEYTIEQMMNEITAMFICNSLIGIRAVKRVADKSLSINPVDELRANL